MKEKIVDAFRKASAMLITTGAGMCVDSVLPDFSGAEGIMVVHEAVSQLFAERRAR